MNPKAIPNPHQFLQGSIVALVTPFHEDGSLDETSLRSLVNWHIQEGTDAIVPCGTTGESATLTHEEHHRVINIVVDEVNGRIPVIAGAGSNSTQEAISFTHHAQEIGADAVLSISPYYNKPTQRGIIEHYRAINEIGIPVIIYNVPSRTGSNITAETTLEIAEMENMVGIKEASGDLNQVTEIIRNRPRDFAVLSGDDGLAYSILALGGDGCISVIANEIPAKFSRLMHLCLDGNWDEARKLQMQLWPLMQANFLETNPIPVKTALNLMGKISATVRSPLFPMNETNLTQLRQILNELEVIS